MTPSTAYHSHELAQRFVPPWKSDADFVLRLWHGRELRSSDRVSSILLCSTKTILNPADGHRPIDFGVILLSDIALALKCLCIVHMSCLTQTCIYAVDLYIWDIDFLFAQIFLIFNTQIYILEHQSPPFSHIAPLLHKMAAKPFKVVIVGGGTQICTFHTDFTFYQLILSTRPCGVNSRARFVQGGNGVYRPRKEPPNRTGRGRQSSTGTSQLASSSSAWLTRSTTRYLFRDQP